MDLSENSIAGFILNIVNDKVSGKFSGDREFVDSFIKRISDNLPLYTDFGDNFTFSFSPGGSSYEGLAVKDETEFDISVLLGRPFEMANFHIERDERSKFFTIKWKSHIRRKIFCDHEGYVNTLQLRQAVFGKMTRAIQRIYISGTSTAVKEGPTTLVITVRLRSGRTISLDFMPQFVFRSRTQCPNLLPLSVMTSDQRRYFDILNTNRAPAMCFSLTVPNRERFINNNKLLNISFSLLEKEYFQKNTQIRDMVRLVKVVADRRDWTKNFGFQSYFAKQVAIKNDALLSNRSLWEGYLALLGYLKDQLSSTGTSDILLIGEQASSQPNRLVVGPFIREINMILKIPAKELLDLA